jgi:hypothetical protein
MTNHHHLLVDAPDVNLSKGQRRALAKPLADSAADGSDRDRAMAEAYPTGASGMNVIDEHFGVSRMTVSCAVKRHEGAGVTCVRPSTLPVSLSVTTAAPFAVPVPDKPRGVRATVSAEAQTSRRARCTPKRQAAHQ